MAQARTEGVSPKTNLSTLPHNHPLRNKPLSGAFYNMNGGKALFEVKDTFSIAKQCYNDLGGAWVDYSEFHYPSNTETEK